MPKWVWNTSYTLYKEVDGLALRVGAQFVVGRADVREEAVASWQSDDEALRTTLRDHCPRQTAETRELVYRNKYKHLVSSSNNPSSITVEAQI